MSWRGWNVRWPSGAPRRTAAAAAGLLLLAAQGCAARSPGEALEARFAAGNEAYEEGDYERAVTIYRDIEAREIRSAALHYNLGNALFKSGSLGEAILQYEKAVAIDPRDPDARDNLSYLRTLTLDEITPAPSPLTSLGISYLLGLTTPGQDALAAALFWLLAGAAFSAGVLARSEGARRTSFYAAGALVLPALIAGGALATKIWLERSAEHAIVLAAEAEVLSGAGGDNPALFTVHEGLKVLIRGRAEGWVQVSLENGLSGWLPAGTLGEI